MLIYSTFTYLRETRKRHGKGILLRPEVSNSRKRFSCRTFEEKYGETASFGQHEMQIFIELS